MAVGRVGAALVAASLALLSCTPQVGPGSSVTQTPLAWTAVDLPDGLTPSALLATADGLLVGGRSGSGEAAHPVLAKVAEDQRVRSVLLRAHSPYAEVADLVSLAAAGDQVAALGAAHGGAHSNFRWTVWTGRTAAGLDDRPQTFETFGGQQAGGLLDVVWTEAGAMIVGTWSGAAGLDAAVWRADGTRWVREPSAGTALANEPQRQVAPRAAYADDERTVIAGSTITFADGVRQSAAIWTRDGDDAWRRTDLPELGERSEALSTACRAVCWTAGYVDDQLALWRTDSGGATRVDLPSLSVSPDGRGPRTVLLGDRVGVLASVDDRVELVVSTGEGWQRYAGPTGSLVDAAVTGDRLYAASTSGDRTQLWSAALPPAG